MLRFLVLFCLLGMVAHAEDFHIDGFGIVPHAGISQERTNWAGTKGLRKQTVVKAGDISRILFFAGPKSLVAGKDDGHAVALGTDKFGNLISGVATTFNLENLSEKSATMLDGIGHIHFVPPPKSTDLLGSARVDTIQSARAMFRVTADLSTVDLMLDSADDLRSERISQFATRNLRDRFGNPIEDGVGAALVLAHKDGSHSLAFGDTKQSQLRLPVMVRDMASSATGTTYMGAASDSAFVDFEPLLAALPADILVWREAEIQALGVRVGPLTTTEGYLLPDGAPIRLTIAFGQKETLTKAGWVRDGVFETLVPEMALVSQINVQVYSPLGLQTSDANIGKKPRPTGETQ